MPQLLVIGGPNGAGKSTSGRALMTSQIDAPFFLNADLIARGLALVESAEALTAARIMLRRFDELLEERRDFGVEATLAGLSLAVRIEAARSVGYRVGLIYVSLSSADLSVQRIAEREKRGGHSVPEADARRRFGRSHRNFLVRYRPLSDWWRLYDNSGGIPQIVAEGERGRPELVYDADLWTHVLTTRARFSSA